MKRRNRRDAASGPANTQAALVLAALDRLLAPSQAELNLVRLRSASRILWATDVAAIAICPGWDDYLVWTNLVTEPALAVPMSDVADEDYKLNVHPVLRRHSEAARNLQAELREAEDTWHLTTCAEARKHTIVTSGQLEHFLRKQPPKPTQEEMPSADAVTGAHTEVVETLIAFIDRNEHGPDADLYRA